MFTTKDIYGRKVSLYSSVWEHIQREHHEFTNWKPLMLTVEEPNVIGISKLSITREVYYKIGAHEKYPNLYVAVVTEFDQSFGKIVTGHLAAFTDPF